VAGGRGKSVFFCPSDFLSPYFSDYTKDESLKTNFRFIDPTPKKTQNKTKQKQIETKNKSHFGAVSPQRFILQLLTQSGVWNYHITNTSISYRLIKQNIFFKWRSNRLYNIFALASMQDDVI